MGLSAEQIVRNLPRRWFSGLDYAVIKSSKLVKSKGAKPRIESIVKLTRTLDHVFKEPPLRPHKVVIQNADTEGVPFYKAKTIIVSCDCEDFIYRWEYALARKRAAVIKLSNGKPPVVRNPRLIAGSCRHIGKVLITILKKKV